MLFNVTATALAGSVDVLCLFLWYRPFHIIVVSY